MRALRNNRGQAMVEFALILPIVLLILLGIMEFGVILSNQMILENASREAVRYGVLGATDTEIKNYINDLTSSLDFAHLMVTISPSEGSRSKGSAMTVTLVYQHQLMLPMIQAIVGDNVNLKASTTMRVE